MNRTVKLGRFFCLAGAWLTVALSASAAPIVLKTGQTTLTRTRQFELRDGVVYGGPLTASAAELQPVTSLAGPFTTPPRFRSIQADSSILVAQAEDGRLFFLEFPTPGTLAAKVIPQWTDQWGMPFHSQLKLPRGAKAWSFSNRNLDVGQFEDAQGQPFFWGFAGCSTLYALSHDGQRIHYADPWLPADFSREICPPAQGTFIAENLSSSGSTLFVIGRDGEMFTRLEDYDTNGGTPFYDFRYTPVRPHGLAGSDPASEYMPRRPFGPDWQAQPPIPLSGQARISREITILQTGIGNAARQLRVAGRNPQGQPGYYFKGLMAGLKPLKPTAWRFQPAALQIRSQDWLDVDLSAEGRRRTRSTVALQTLSGHGWREGVARNTEFRLSFSWACGPALLSWQEAGQAHTARLHLADGWLPFAQAERYAADEVQQPFVRAYKATLELPAELQQDPDLGPLHAKSFALSLLVGPGWARLWGERGVEMRFGTEKELPLFTSRLAQAEVAAANPLAALATDLALYADFAREREALAAQKDFARNLQLGFGLFAHLGLITGAGPALMKAPFWNAVQHGQAIVRLNDAWTYDMEELTRGDYALARSMLRRRICAASARLAPSRRPAPAVTLCGQTP